MTLADKVTQFTQDADAVHQWAAGGAATSVDMGGGPVRSPAKLIADKDAEINASATGILAGAQSAKDGATTQATAAAAAKTLAEAASATAAAVAKRYPDTATALADATLANGSYFSTPSNVSSEAAIIYLKSGGVATESTRVANASVVQALADRLQDTTLAGYAWAVLDALGRAALGVASDGSLRGMDAVFKALAADSLAAPSVTATALTASTINGSDASSLGTILAALGTNVPQGYAWALTDGLGRAALGVKNDGTTRASALEADTINGAKASDIAALVAPPPSGYGADIVHILTYGQSLSRGVRAAPVITTAQPYDSLRFSGGVRPDDSATPYASLVPLIETTVTDGGGLSSGETPSAGTAHAVKQLIANEDGITFAQQSYQLLLSADGQGSTSVLDLSKGGTQFARMVSSMQAGFNLSQAAGKTYKVGAITWTQGEQDSQNATASALYRQRLHTLRQDLQDQAQTITGQAEPVRMICYQLATHKVFGGNAYPTIALALLAASKESDYVFLATPMYHLAYSPADNGHLLPDSSKKLGFHYGLVYKRVVVDGKKWKPLMPISKFRQGAVATVKFNVPKGKLVFDTTLVAANTNMGFNLFQADGVTAIGINSVAITGPDTIRIVAAAPIPAGARLQYAFYGTGPSGPINGPRGNLRDTQGDTIVFDPTGLNYPAHNWCVMFEEIF